MPGQKKKLVIVLIHYNTPQYLKTCIPSVIDQSYDNWELIFIDNNSPDKEGLDFMHQKYDSDKRITIISNMENSGYAKAANQGIKIALSKGADYISITNPDIIFSPDYFQKLVTKLNYNKDIASITGKVYKYNFATDKPTDVIDSVGLFAYKNRRVIDRGQGLVDDGQFNDEQEVFGVSGACPLYRAEALEDVKIFDQYFDEDFFMYKEDVDLAWRFLLFGWRNYYLPGAVAYHGRGTGVAQRFSLGQAAKKRGSLSQFQKTHSFRNQLSMELKNDLWTNRFYDFLHIFPVKLASPFYIIFVEPYLIKSYFQYLKQIPRTLKKRRQILSKKRASAEVMRKWFN